MDGFRILEFINEYKQLATDIDTVYVRYLSLIGFLSKTFHLLQCVNSYNPGGKLCSGVPRLVGHC